MLDYVCYDMVVMYIKAQEIVQGKGDLQTKEVKCENKNV